MAGLLQPTAVAAAAGLRLPKPKPIAAAGGPNVTKPNRIAPDASAELNMTAAPTVHWPTGTQADLDLSASTGSQTLSTGAWSKAPNLPVSAASVTADSGSPARIRVQLLAQPSASVRPIVLRVASLDAGGPVQVRVDYSGFAHAFGGDWAARLHLVSLPECALSTPGATGCAAQDLTTVNDHAAGTVTTTVTVPAGRNTQSAAGGQVVALVAGASSSGGDYTATPLQASSTWTAGGQAGDFDWTYPMRTPPSLGGPAPTVGLAYSAQAVDGMTSAANSQPSWIGEGFSFQSGSITRSYKGCATDGQTGVGDECWFSDNATLSMSGHGGELIPDATVPNLWHPKNDDGTRVERLTGASNGDNDGEYWRVTTTDGGQYFFGLNRLPGWSTGKPVTNSALTVPVFGNNTGEPCHQSTFTASYCSQAYQWNLDYVIDPHHNTASYWYTPETNNYARTNTSTSVSSYVRGATLTRIDYGTRQDANIDSEYSVGAAPQRVNFGVLDRCITQGATCVADTAHASNWPDVPWDQQCTSSSSCPNIYSPVFFSQKMLSTVTTQIWTGSGTTYSDVDTWTLNHVFKDPQDGYTQILWLNSISHVGKRGMTTAMPDTKFTSTLTNMNNRVDTSSLDPIIRFRIASILTDTGAQINLGYTSQECVKGTNMPASPDSNTKRCFPVYWTPPGQTTPTLDWFHKYLVSNVTIVNTAEAGSLPDSYTYTYLGNPAWHYDEGEFVPDANKTWAQWRGYPMVRVQHGQGGTTQSQTDTIYFQGMNGDHLASGASRNVTIPPDPDFGGVALADEPWRQGQTRETISYNGVSDTAPVITKILNAPWEYGPTATRTRNGVTVNAYLTGIKSVTTKTALDGGRGWRTTLTTTTFDADAGLAVKVGRVVTQDDQGDTSTATDDRCTRITYAENTTGWLVSLPAETETVGVNCATTPNRNADILTDTRVWYDGATSFGTTISIGDATRTERLAAWNSGSPTYQQVGRAHFDADGRAIDTYDALDRHTITAYTPASGAPVTAIGMTNPLGWTTIETEDPAWGSPTRLVDANGHHTDTTYDGLGRKTAIWLAGRDIATQTASMTFGYVERNDGLPNAVATSILNTAGTGYTTKYTIYDALLRPRQRQQAAPGGGRIISDTFYDSRGLAYLTNAPYFSAASPGVILAAQSTVPSSILTTYDNGGRPTAVIFRVDGSERWRSSIYYGGDHTDVTTPAGGTATSTWTDARGQTTTLRQFHGSTPIGSYDTTTYTYARTGDRLSIVDSAGNSWHYEYDQQHRKITVDDPDSGHSSYTYDGADEILTGTDARGTTMAYTYDALNRKTAEYNATVAPANQLAGWTYDTIAKGQLTSSTRYVGGAGGSAYINAVTGFDAGYRATGSTVTIPASEGSLAGTYTSSSTLNVDGSVATTTIPAVGSGTGRLAAETLTYGYDSLGSPTTLTGLSTYVTESDYDSLGNKISAVMSDGSGKTLNEIWSYEYGTNRLAEHGVQDPDLGTVYQDTYYSYDDSGNVTEVSNQTNQYGAGPDDNQCFRYDYLHRLTDAWTPASTSCTTNPTVSALGGPAPYWQSWTYDSTGNRLTQVDHTSAGSTTHTSTYPTAGAAQPHTLLSVANTPPPVGVVTTDAYTYDAAGETKTRAVAGQSTQTLGWDPEGRLSSVADSTGTTSYIYDADGNRLISKDPAGSTLYLANEQVRSTGGTLAGTRFYGTAASRTAAGGLTWLTTDPHRTAELAFRASDLSVNKRYLTPYGSPRNTVTWPNSHGFVNGTVDASGLTHLGARDYDPATGRFISDDPVTDAAIPQQIQGYGYANGSPVTMSDPDGLEPGSWCLHSDCAVVTAQSQTEQPMETGYVNGKAVKRSAPRIDPDVYASAYTHYMGQKCADLPGARSGSRDASVCTPIDDGSRDVYKAAYEAYSQAWSVNQGYLPIPRCMICEHEKDLMANAGLPDVGLTDMQRKELRAGKNADISIAAIKAISKIDPTMTCEPEPQELMIVCHVSTQVVPAGRNGFTIGNVYFTSVAGPVDPEILKHEARHATQWAVLGETAFVAIYSGDAAFCGTNGANIMEIMAGLESGGYDSESCLEGAMGK